MCVIFCFQEFFECYNSFNSGLSEYKRLPTIVNLAMNNRIKSTPEDIDKNASEEDPNVEFFDRLSCGVTIEKKNVKKIDRKSKASTPIVKSKLTEHESLQKYIEEAIDSAIIELGRNNQRRGSSSLILNPRRSPRTKAKYSSANLALETRKRGRDHGINTIEIATLQRQTSTSTNTNTVNKHLQ